MYFHAVSYFFGELNQISDSGLINIYLNKGIVILFLK